MKIANTGIKYIERGGLQFQCNCEGMCCIQGIELPNDTTIRNTDQRIEDYDMYVIQASTWMDIERMTIYCSLIVISCDSLFTS